MDMRTGSNAPGAHAFTVRAATAGDVPLILGFIKELAAYEKLSDRVSATEADLRAALFGPSPAAEVVLGCAGDAPAGFALFFQSFSTFLGRPGMYLEDLFVRPDWRGKGLGRQLLVHLARVAVARQYGRMEWSVLDWNEPAIAFYRAIGARPLDDWTMFRLTGETLVRLAS
jgi:GNAT superfamily N-acetyltransferase